MEKKEQNWDGTKETIQKANLRVAAANEHAKKVTDDPTYRVYVAQGYYNAMSEVAGREESDAVEFAKWATSKHWRWIEGLQVWKNPMQDIDQVDSAQLYQLFKQRPAEWSGEKEVSNG